MQYGDEASIAKRKAALATQALDIENEIEIKGVTYTFARKEFPDYKISMIVPEQLETLAEEIVKLKYPSEHRPQLILSTPTQSLDLLVSLLLHEQVQPENISEKTADLRMAAKRMNPAAVFANMDVAEAETVIVPFYEAQIAVFDGEICSTTFTASIEGHLLLGSFVCSYEERHLWRVLIKQMLESVLFLGESEGSHAAKE